MRRGSPRAGPRKWAWSGPRPRSTTSGTSPTTTSTARTTRSTPAPTSAGRSRWWTRSGATRRSAFASSADFLQHRHGARLVLGAVERHVAHELLADRDAGHAAEVDPGLAERARDLRAEARLVAALDA